MLLNNFHTQDLLKKPDSLIIQFQHEIETWERILAFLSEENINLMDRLTEILKIMEATDKKFLERIEYFQSSFLDENKTVGSLRSEVNEQDRLLFRDIYENGKQISEVKKKQKKLRKELEIAEKEFNKLKFEFNNYLGEIL